jgi:hypothetical protein
MVMESKPAPELVVIVDAVNAVNAVVETSLAYRRKLKMDQAVDSRAEGEAWRKATDALADLRKPKDPLAVARVALEKLACLGNEPYVGNRASIMIARRALDEMDGIGK